MGDHVERWRQANPELKPVEGDENEAVLMWAHREGYITLTEFSRKFYYAQSDLNSAVLWDDKMGGGQVDAANSESN